MAITAHAANFSRVFPDIADMLWETIPAGWRLAVYANKLAVAALSVDQLFATIGGGDNFASPASRRALSTGATAIPNSA